MTRQNAYGQPIGAPLETTLPRPRPERRPMQGRYCRVAPLEDGHAAALHAAFTAADAEGDPRADWTYLPNGPYEIESDFAGWCAQAAASEDPLFHTISDAADTPLGHASYLRIDPGNGAIEVGFIHFARRLQGTRAATEAMFLMMANAFDTLGYRRYEWKCDALNAPSRRAAARLGFSYEGTFRQATHYKGRNRDTAWFSVINAEWPVVKAGFEAWLDPANFDAADRQRRRLEDCRAGAAARR